MEALRERFGKYHVLEKIAQGGMAEVYKVKTVGIAGFEKIQALKRILPHSAREARFIRSFIDEARIAVELTHRNIVQVFDFGKADGELFMAMELIEGRDLRTAMAQGIANDHLCPTAVAAFIIGETAAGLDYAHRKTDLYGGALGIVHCDVSPSNVMLSTDGYVKILDFGIARATFASALERRRLRGKPRYMAPEQTLGEPPTAQADVFALGIIAWELFTGMPLFRGNDVKSILEAVRKTNPPRIDRMNPDVPTEVADAIAVALTRDPAARATAADLGNAMSRTAMAASARHLAIWLRELDALLAERGYSSRETPTATNAALKKLTQPALQGPPLRPSTRSLTGSLAALAPALAPNEFGEGTPGMPGEPPTRTSQLAFGEQPTTRRPETGAGPRLQTEPMTTKYDRLTTTGPSHLQQFGDRDPTSSVTSHGQYGVDPTGTVPAPRFAQDATSTSNHVVPRWGHESTSAGVGKLQDAFDAFDPPGASGLPSLAPADEPIAPPPAARYERLVSLAGTNPASLRFDDEATQFGAAAPDEASFHDLQVESDEIAPDDDAPIDEPIDDDLGALATGAFSERRRAVVVAGMLDGGSHEELRPIARTLGELAYQRGGVVLRIDDDSLVVAFGLEIAGEDDVAVAMGWALDAAVMTRDAGGVEHGHGGPSLRIGARTGVATTIATGTATALGPETGRAQRISGTRDAVLPPDGDSAIRPGRRLPSDAGSIARALDVPSLRMPADSDSIRGRPDASQRLPADGDSAVRAGRSDPSLRVPGDTGNRAALEPEPRLSLDVGSMRIPGDAIEDARALAREAAPDRPLFVGAAGRMTSGLYTLREVPAPKRIRRGKVIEVVGRRGFGDRDRARLERRGTFVGRTAQLAELDTWFERAVAADRRLTALISGAAGTGKSRLVAELTARRAAATPGLRTIFCTANPASRNAPFSLVIDFYQAALGLPPARGRAARAEVVHRVMLLMRDGGVPEERAREVATDLDRAMELRDGVGVGMPEVADLRPRISAGLSTFRSAMADRQRPLLAVIEDVHLGDGASLEVLRHVLAVTQMGPELLVLTARPEGSPPPAVDVEIGVGDLVGAELRALIADRLGDVATPLNIAAVMARGGGNPLFIEELAQAVREAGDDIPASARDVVAARVDRLTPRAKVALRFAAVLGGTMRRALLDELAGADDAGDDGAGASASALDELIDGGFLVRPESSSAQAEGELQFARGLIREVIYESLSARAQRESHARVGRLLASRFFAGREEPPAVIAEHMERGGETAGAAAFWLRAGRLSLAAFDAAAAVSDFSRTLVLERELGVEPPTLTSRARRREALAGRDEAHRVLGDPGSDAGDLDELERLCGGDIHRLADVSIRRAQRLLRLGDYGGANIATVNAEDHAIAAADSRLRGEALRVRGEVLERLGRFDEALVVVGDAVELFAREGALGDEMAAMVGRGRIHLMRAHYEAARDAYRPVIARIEKTHDPYLERIVQNHVAIIEMCLGNFSLAMASAERSLELCRRYGDRSREGDALSVAGIILLDVGRYDDAAARFSEALELLSRTASRWSRADCLIYAGVCDIRRGGAVGLTMLDEALAEARRLGARYLEANALISRAGAHLRRGALDAAIEDAAAGTLVARNATLVGYEIQGLARHALALVRRPSSNQHAEAVAQVHRALALLEQQRYLEGSEEEVFASCAQVLEAAGAPDRAAVVRARGRIEVQRKLAGLTDPAWRASYAAIAEHRALLA